MAIRAAFQTSLTFPAADTRRALLGGMAHSPGPALGFREGVLPGGSASLAVSSSAGMTLAVQAGQAVVVGYLVTVDAPATIAVAPAGVTARTDLVILRVRDTESGDGASSAVIEMVTGASISVPAVPARSYVLAQVAVGASVSSINSGNLTDRRTFTAASGGTLQIPGALSAAPSGLIPGQQVWDALAGQVGIVNTAGTGWQSLSPAGDWQNLVNVAGWTATTGRYRIAGDYIELDGILTKSSPPISTTVENCGAGAFAPSVTQVVDVLIRNMMAGTAQNGMLLVTAAGGLQVGLGLAGISNPNAVMLTGKRYLR